MPPCFPEPRGVAPRAIATLRRRAARRAFAAGRPSRQLTCRPGSACPTAAPAPAPTAVAICLPSRRRSGCRAGRRPPRRRARRRRTAAPGWSAGCWVQPAAATAASERRISVGLHCHLRVRFHFNARRHLFRSGEAIHPAIGGWPPTGPAAARRRLDDFAGGFQRVRGLARRSGPGDDRRRRPRRRPARARCRARARPASIVASVPSSIGGLRCPMWPMRKMLSGSVPGTLSPIPSVSPAASAHQRRSRVPVAGRGADGGDRVAAQRRRRRC